jgi:hypothetical protein
MVFQDHNCCYVGLDFERMLGGLTVSIPVSLWSLKYVPDPQGEEADVKDKWKRLDLQGSMLYVRPVLCSMQSFADQQYLCRNPTPHSQSHPRRIIRLANTLFPSPIHPIHLPIPRILLLGKPPSRHPRSYTASHMDLPEFPTLGRSQYL